MNSKRRHATMRMVVVCALLAGAWLIGVRGEENKMSKRTYTVVTEAQRKITVVFIINAQAELREVRIELIPPSDDDAQLVVKDAFVATDGTRIPLVVSWADAKPRTMKDFMFEPLHPKPDAASGKHTSQTYLLRATDGSLLRLVCKWIGKDLLNIGLDLPKPLSSDKEQPLP